MQQNTRSLSILTCVNYLNYIDRYILAAVLTSIKSDLGLSDFQAGLLATAFMFPYMFTSPLFGWLGDSRRRSKILSAGAAVWSCASVLTGIASTFNILAASRFLLGIGESAFTVLSVPFISDSFAENERGRKLAIFSTALPVGAALGYVLGGLLGSTVGWRGSFTVVGAPGIIFAALIWRLPDPRPVIKAKTANYFAQTVGLFRSRSYAFAVFGYCAYAFVVGGIAHWVPTFLQRDYGLTQMEATTLFGGVAVITGLAGTLIGGALGDRLHKRWKHGHLRLSAGSMLLALPCYIGIMQTHTVIGFATLLVFTEFLFFISTSPINVALLGAAPAELGTTAIAIAIFFCHILGDAISAPLIGYISDRSDLRTGLAVCSPVILLCSILWFLGSRDSAKNLPEQQA